MHSSSSVCLIRKLCTSTTRLMNSNIPKSAFTLASTPKLNEKVLNHQNKSKMRNVRGCTAPSEGIEMARGYMKTFIKSCDHHNSTEIFKKECAVGVAI